MIGLLLALLFLFTFGLIALYGAPYVPSRKSEIKDALVELYPLGRKDTLVDIGSGGGVVLRQASSLGAKAIGYELNPLLYGISKFLSRKDKKVSVHFADYWTAHLPDETTVVYVFSVMRDMKKIGRWVQNQANRIDKPIHLISFGFELGGKKADKNVGAYFLYIINPLQSDKAQV
ncbi:hypothetical protein HGB24_02830 [Candidatus Saccharibacteria bacterium]|nr:hypothetical protein [Candidatus Saccharibacteria bacterium]